MRNVLVLAALAAAASSASAGVAFFNGDTTGQPTWNRPTSLSSLSGVGTATPYQVTPFFVSAAGTYSFEVDGRGHTDTYALAYSSFSAGSPLVGLLNGDDDYSGPLPNLGGTGQGFASSYIASGETSNFAAGGLNLAANTQYYAVVTGFGNTDFGAYAAAIAGPGNVTIGLVPAPASLALVGLGGLVAGRRRR